MVKRKTSVAFLLVAVLCGLAAALLSGGLLTSYAQTVDVVVATTDIGPGEQLRGAALSMVPKPAAAVPRDAILNLAEAEGKFLRFGVVKESIIRQSHLAEGAVGGQLSTILTYTEDPRHRALAIPFSGIVSVGGAVAAHDRIDLIASIVVGKEPVSRIIARGVRVLSVTPEGQGVPSVVLAVTPELAEELVFVLENGTLYAALNPFGADLSAAVTDGFYSAATFERRHAGTPKLPVEPQVPEEDGE